MKALLCWLLGHDWAPITGKAEIDTELNRLLRTGEIYFCQCGRCGVKGWKQ